MDSFRMWSLTIGKHNVKNLLQLTYRFKFTESKVLDMFSFHSKLSTAFYWFFQQIYTKHLLRVKLLLDTAGRRVRRRQKTKLSKSLTFRNLYSNNGHEFNIMKKIRERDWCNIHRKERSSSARWYWDSGLEFLRRYRFEWMFLGK